MKCWICEKEETNPDIRINIDSLIWVVCNYFDNVETLSKEAKKKPYYKRSVSEQAFINNYSAICDAGSREISTICEILDIDWKRLYTIARFARKWEQKRNWKYCFPAQDNAKKIIEWLTAKDEPFDSNINYINYKINQKAAKQVA